MKRPQKIKIVFDAGPLVNGNLTGVGRATAGLISALASAFPDDVVLVGHYFNFLGRKHPITLPTAANIRYRRTVLIPGKVFNMLRRMRFPVPYELLTKERADFHLFPGFLGWPSLFKTPSAPFIHDITYIDYPEYMNDPALFDLKTIMPQTIRRAAFILTNSESSKSGICREYSLGQKPILVEHIPPVGAIEISQAEADVRIQKLGITKLFLLFFGTLEPRKNLVGLLDAYSLLPETIRNEHCLVIGGGKGWKDDEILAKIEKLRADGQCIIQTGYVSDEDRAALFMKAAIYLMPSHYEGFGMQLLEGMQYKTPMIVSDIPVLREVGAGAAIYAQTDAQSIATAIEKLLGNDATRRSLIVAGQKRLKDFSWPKVAHEVYEEISRYIRI